MMRKKQEINILPIAEDYFNTIFSEVTEMKALVLDSQTSGIISIVYTQSKLYKNDVYLIQKIEDVKEKLTHLKGVYFIRPTKENITLLREEIKNPHFKQYHLFFTNSIEERFISELAEADSSDRIRNLQEVYLDYYPVGRNIFSLKIPSTIGIMKKRDFWKEADKGLINRISEGLISIAMSLRILPQVKYISDSDSCAEIARQVSLKLQDELMKKPSDYPKDERTLLIITQRKEDVVTPLMTPWTYQAVLHESYGIYDNKVDIKNRHKAFLASQQERKSRDSQSIKQKQARQFVLSEIEDEFYRKNVYEIFAEVITNIQKTIQDLANKKNKHLNIQSLEDMHDVISKTPELVAFQSTVEKHTNLSWDLLQEMKKGELHEVSRVEQDLICQDSRKDSIEGIWKLMKNNEIDYFHKLKLVILYSVRFPNDKEIKEFLSFLENINPDKTMLSLVSLIQQYQYNRKSDLFHSRNLKKKAVSFFERILKDVPSVFTGHKPYLFENVLPDLIFDRAKESQYRTAFLGRQSSNRNKPLVIVFFVGGVTYSEAKEAEDFEDARVVVGGTFIHNSKTFISEVIQLENSNDSSF